MDSVRLKNWILVVVLGHAYWLFGNLYEAVVISPNWVTDSPEQMRRLNEFFVNTSPTLYFVPLTQLATILLWFLLWINPVENVKPDLRRASIVALSVTLLNIFIVSTIVTKLFGEDYAAFGNFLTTLTWRWNILNLVRMLLVGMVIHYSFRAFRKLDRLGKTEDVT